MFVVRAELTPNVNAWDGEVISDWPLTGVFDASLKWLLAQLFKGWKRLASGRHFATLTYSLTALGDVVPYFGMSDSPLPVAWTRSRHFLATQLLRAGAGPTALLSAWEMHHTDNFWLGGGSAFRWPSSPLALLWSSGTARSCLEPPPWLQRRPRYILGSTLPQNKQNSCMSIWKDSPKNVSSKIKHGLSVQDCDHLLLGGLSPSSALKGQPPII